MCLAASENQTDEEYAKVADILMERQVQSPLTVAQVQNPTVTPCEFPRQEAQITAVTERPALTQKVDEMGERLAKIEDAIRNLGRTPPPPTQSPPPTAAPRQEPGHSRQLYPRQEPSSPYCFYHNQFGHRAFKCQPPCSWPRTPPGQYDPEDRSQYSPAGNAQRGGWQQ